MENYIWIGENECVHFFIDIVEEKEEEDFGEDSTEEDDDTFLEETFLDDEYCIREEVHEKFKRCTHILQIVLIVRNLCET